MNEVFETVAEVLEELRSEAEEREYSVHTNESENADKALKRRIGNMKQCWMSFQQSTENFLKIIWI